METRRTVAQENVFRCQRCRQNSNGIILNGSAKYRWGAWVKIGDFRAISRYISETVQDRNIDTMEG